MTNEVAIKAIQDFIGWFKEDSLIRKALEMAIKALSQEPSVNDVLEQIRAEIEREGAMFPDGEFFVSIDRINEIIDNYK